ncbi:hypothetical protein BJ875DRAFT_124338 [Amylocarpus encephaloides]|uniref:Vacuolar protein sorting-associated protein 62 n=1 Tax=Amylocarpus encephaloides TaxID=45428 RepID=A0A9P7YDZ9_9HELO|nr:hypothetical protein BJ875DRAFT_124338 [Amylocarpus encephaloides]
MAINEKGAVDDGELEKGIQVYAVIRECVEDDSRRPSWAGLIEGACYKILFAIALLVFYWHCGFAFARPLGLARRVAGVPQFVLDYAPIVYMDTGEAYFPSDIGAQIANTHPRVVLETIPDPPALTIDNLDILNSWGDGGSKVYLTSNSDVTKGPTPCFLKGIVPDASGKTQTAISCAIIINDHGCGQVDAYYMYFYAYNQGNTVFGQELGDHIGDWEHNMIRFSHGKPQAMWFSQHAGGQAFTYDAMEKIGKRPVSYSAKGSHANYAVKGVHDHTIPGYNLPGGPLQDYTSQGVVWDPTLNVYFYNYHAKNLTFGSINGSPLGAMYYRGQWGDAQYADEDERQKDFFGFKKFVGGPTGPVYKQLNRTNVCPIGRECIVRDTLGP